MESQMYIVTGTLTDKKFVTLDESLPISDTSGTKVRVTIERLGNPQARPLDQVLADIHHQQQARGFQPPTPQAVEEYLRQERNSWE